MYTIKQAAARTGLSVPIIRVWERRYGVVQPGRTPAGYRLYDDESIARLAAMRQLVAEEGWQPSQAAQRVLEPGADLAALSGGRAESDADARLVAGVREGDGETVLVQAFLAAAHELDVPSMERILDEGFASQRFELAIESLVSPALRAVGVAWARHEIDVGAEHAASETVRRRLARFYDAAGLGDRRHGWSWACLPTATTRSGHSPSRWPPGGPDSPCSISVRMCQSRAGSGPSGKPKRRSLC